MWGEAYLDLKYESRANLFYRLVFCARRFLLGLTVYKMYEYPSLQILLFFCSNMLASLYHGTFMPLRSRTLNRLHIVNEFFIAAISYITILFTDMVDS